MGNDDIESNAFTEILGMAHSDEFKVIIREYSNLLKKLADANNLTPQELAGLIYFANERLSADVSIIFTFYTMDFVGGSSWMSDKEKRIAVGRCPCGRADGDGDNWIDCNIPPDECDVKNSLMKIMRGKERSELPCKGEHFIFDGLCRLLSNQRPGDGCKPALRMDICPCRIKKQPPNDPLMDKFDEIVGRESKDIVSKVLCFFLEHPIHAFDISKITTYLDVPMDVVKKNLDMLVELDYIIMVEEGHYELKRSKEMVNVLIGRLADLQVKSCVCISSPPGVALSDGTCGNCGGVVELDFYNESMERRYGLRVCPECGHENRHPNNHCDKCTKYLKPFWITMKCPRCGEATRKGNRCDHCNYNIPTCYGVVAPRTQDCANCVHAVKCIEEQKRPVISDEPMMETWNCPKCDRVELIIYAKCLSCGYNRDDLPFHPSHELQLPSDDLIEVAKTSTETILCPNCKQPVGDKHEHLEGDRDDRWWKCPDVGSEEENQ